MNSKPQIFVNTHADIYTHTRMSTHLIGCTISIHCHAHVGLFPVLVGKGDACAVGDLWTGCVCLCVYLCMWRGGERLRR